MLVKSTPASPSSFPIYRSFFTHKLIAAMLKIRIGKSTDDDDHLGKKQINLIKINILLTLIWPAIKKVWPPLLYTVKTN
jgi:hypothetical protein